MQLWVQLYLHCVKISLFVKLKLCSTKYIVFGRLRVFVVWFLISCAEKFAPVSVQRDIQYQTLCLISSVFSSFLPNYEVELVVFTGFQNSADTSFRPSPSK